MRTITKSQEPQSLIEHRATPNATYDGYKEKDDLRTVMVRDQGAICCYCMARIRPTRAVMKIEHFRCQTNHPDLELNFNNLFAACLGNPGQSPNKQHCDTRKGSSTFSRELINTPYRLEELVHYRSNGEIFAKDPDLDRDLNEVLNLNFGRLVENRKAALDAFRIYLNTKKNKGKQLTRPAIEALIQRWNGTGQEGITLEPYCQVVVYWLRKRLNRG